MLNIMLTDLVPIFVIMILGYVSGKKGEFNAANARSLNQFVLNYALPAGLFVSIVKADRAMLFSDIRLSLVSLGVIVGCYFWSYFSCLKFFKHSKAEASIAGLVGGAPTIGYLGFAVLEPIYGTSAPSAWWLRWWPLSSTRSPSRSPSACSIPEGSRQPPPAIRRSNRQTPSSTR